MKTMELCDRDCCAWFFLKKGFLFLSFALFLSFIFFEQVSAAIADKAELPTSVNTYILRSIPFVGADVNVRGKVTDQNGLGIPGVSVTLKGTAAGVVTDSEGAYTLTVPETGVLVFSFVGYNAVEEPVKGRTLINVRLTENSQALTEVVVVGYGTQRKAVVSGAVTSVKGAELTKSPSANLSNSLAGRLPGVTAVQVSGEPGYDGSTIRIRGVNSLGNNNALIVIDGVPNRAGGLERLNANDIESVSILKDASAAIYGSRAANGVILITTKQGRSGKAQLSYDFTYGLQQPVRIPKMSNASQYAEILNELNIFGSDLPQSQWAAAWRAFNTTGSYLRPDNGSTLNAVYTPVEMKKFRDGSDPLRYPNTDWFGTTLKTWSPQQKHNLQINGGAENTKYLVSLGYLDQDGYYRNSATGYQQYDLRINLETVLNKYVTLGLGITGREEVRNFPTVGAGDIFRMLMRGKPTEMEVWPNGLPGRDIEYGFNPYVITTDLTGYNRDQRDYFQSTGKIEIKVPGIEGLKVTGTAAVDKFSGRQKAWQKPWTLYDWDKKTFEADGVTPVLVGSVRSERTDASLTETAGSQLAVNLMGMVTYDRKINNHQLNLMAGVTREKVNNDGFSAFRRYFLSTALQQLLAGSDKEQAINNPGAEPYNLFNRARLSYFGRVGYNYKEKYLAEFLWRADGSYIFPEDKRFGFFPGISLGWRVSEEKFFKDHVSFVDNLKLRASWGQMGAEAYFGNALAEYQYLSTMGFGNYIINDQLSQTLVENRVPNLSFGWEVANNSNIGLDASFLDNRLSLELDGFYNKRTKIVIARGNSVPGSSGITDKLPPVNLGKVNNKGFEFKLSYNDKKGDFGYAISINGGYAKNKIIFWDETPGAPSWQRSTGMPTGTDLAYQYTGVFKDQAEIDANRIDYSSLTGTLLPGDMKFKDVNGDGKINGDDKIRLDKTSTPTFTGGFNLNLSYKNFDLSALVQGATGGLQIVGLTESGDIGNFLEWSYINRWSIDHPSSEFPRLSNRGKTYFTDTNNAANNTYWLRSNNYVRLKNLELGYTLPPDLCKKIGMSSLRIYVNALNLVTLDKIKIWDPESTNSSAQYYPQARVVSTGIKAVF
jgi:TonB-linked SusC/RagA family outer membrane protein